MAVIEDRGKIRQTGYEKRKEKSCAQHEVFVIVTAKTVQHHSPDKRENLCDLERPLAGFQVNVRFRSSRSSSRSSLECFRERLRKMILPPMASHMRAVQT